MHHARRVPLPSFPADAVEAPHSGTPVSSTFPIEPPSSQTRRRTLEFGTPDVEPPVRESEIRQIGLNAPNRRITVRGMPAPVVVPSHSGPVPVQSQWREAAPRNETNAPPEAGQEASIERCAEAFTHYVTASRELRGYVDLLEALLRRAPCDSFFQLFAERLVVETRGWASRHVDWAYASVYGATASPSPSGAPDLRKLVREVICDACAERSSEGRAPLMDSLEKIEQTLARMVCLGSLLERMTSSWAP